MTWFGLGSQVDARISRYIDNVVSGGGGVAAHASTHVRAGSDEIDGDRVDIDWNPTTYVPTTSPSEVTHVDELTAHLAGIDAAILDVSDVFSWVTGETGTATLTGSFAQVDLDTIQESGGGTFTVASGELTPPAAGTYTMDTAAVWVSDTADGSDSVNLKWQVWNVGTGLWEDIVGQ